LDRRPTFLHQPTRGVGFYEAFGVLKNQNLPAVQYECLVQERGGRLDHLAVVRPVAGS